MSEGARMVGAIWQLGGAAGAVYYVFKLIGYGATARYSTAVGKVLRAEVEARSSGSYGRPNTVQAARIEYEYEVGGRKYRGDVIDAGGSLWTGSRVRADEACRRYPAGSVVAVRYDPADPKRAFLERSAAAFLIGLAGCAAAFIGGWLLRGGLSA